LRTHDMSLTLCFLPKKVFPHLDDGNKKKECIVNCNQEQNCSKSLPISCNNISQKRRLKILIELSWIAKLISTQQI